MKKAQLPAAALPPPASLDEIAAGVWAWIEPDGGWWINNAGFVAGADADVVIDSDLIPNAHRGNSFGPLQGLIHTAASDTGCTAHGSFQIQGGA